MVRPLEHVEGFIAPSLHGLLSTWRASSRRGRTISTRSLASAADQRTEISVAVTPAFIAMK
jgi:hypothetical protein